MATIKTSANYVAPVAGQMANSIATRNAAVAAKTATPVATSPASTTPATSTSTTNSTSTNTKQLTPAALQSTQKAWEGMDLTRQQNFLKNNPTFDIAKYGLKLKTADGKGTSPVVPVVAPEPTVKKEEPPKSSAPQLDYLDSTPERLQQIKDNLNSIYQTNKELFKNRQEFDKAFNFNQRGTEQKKVLNDYYTTKLRESTIESSSSDTLANQIAYGSMGQDAIDFLKDTNPTKYNEIMESLTTKNQQVADDNMLRTMAKTFGDEDANGIPDWYEKNNLQIETAIQEYKDQLNGPEITQKKDELSTLTGEINQIDEDITRVKNEVTEQFPGVPKSQLNAIITDRTEAYMNQKTDKLIQATTLQGYINNRIEEAKLNYSIEQDKIKYEQQDFSNRLQLFNSLRQTNYQKQSLELQKQSLESGKFTTTPDPLGQGVYVTNTKTGEVTLKSWDEFYPGAESTNQSNSNYPINIQDTQNFYNQKPTQVGASDVDLDGTMNQALTAPGIVTVTKAPYMQTDGNIQMQVKTKDGYTITYNHLSEKSLDTNIKVGKSFAAGEILGYIGNSGNVKDIGGNWLRENNIVFDAEALAAGFGSHTDIRVKDPSGKSLSGAEAQAYLKKTVGALSMGANLMGTTSYFGNQTKTTPTSTTVPTSPEAVPTVNYTDANKGYYESQSNIYKQALDGKLTYLDAIKQGYPRVGLARFNQQVNAYSNRIDNALNYVGVDSDEFNLALNGFLATVKKTELIPDIKESIQNLVIKNPALAKPENRGQLLTLATATTEQQKQLNIGLTSLEQKWKTAKEYIDKSFLSQVGKAVGVDAGQVLGGVAYESWVGKLLRFPDRAPKEVRAFLTQRDATARVLAKLVEQGRLSDQDATFYQSLFPEMDTRDLETVQTQLKIIKNMFNSGTSSANADTMGAQQEDEGAKYSR